MPDVSAATTMQTLPHPVPRYADRIQLVRFRRGPDARRWEARVKLPDGKWSPYFSLGTEDRDEACHNAVEELARREGLHRDGRPQPARVAKTGPVRPERTFMDAALPVLERLEKQRNDAKGRLGGNKGNKFESHISCIRNVLCPAFGDTPVADLTRKALNEWARGLTVKGRRGAGEKAPSQNTIGNYNHSLQLVLDRAVELGWIDEEDKPSISKKGFAEAVSTPWLTPDEVERLRDHMTDAWVAAAHDQQSSRQVRYLLRAYVALCSCTGIRPGEELERILPNQVIHEGRGKQAFIRIPVVSHKGKKPRPRDVIVFENDAFDVRAVLEGLAG